MNKVHYVFRIKFSYTCSSFLPNVLLVQISPFAMFYPSRIFHGRYNNYHYYRAAAYMYLQDYAKAKKDCEVAVEMNPQYSRAYHRLGWVPHTSTYVIL